MYIIKTCVYANANGLMFPAMFYTEEKEIVKFSPTGRPLPRNPISVRMFGGCCPIKAREIHATTLTNFENMLEKFGFKFVCVLPRQFIKDNMDVYRAFKSFVSGYQFGKYNRV